MTKLEKKRGGLFKYVLTFQNFSLVGKSLVWDHLLKRRQLQAISIRYQETVNLGEVLNMFITFLI